MTTPRTTLLWLSIAAAVLISGTAPVEVWLAAAGTVTALTVFQRLRHSLFGRDPRLGGR